MSSDKQNTYGTIVILILILYRFFLFCRFYIAFFYFVDFISLFFIL